MSDTFNLVDEPWIKVLKQDNSVEEVSLRCFFRNTSNYVDLAGELPTQDVAVLRILLTILYRAFRVDSRDFNRSIESWKDAWNSKCLPVKEVDDYLDAWYHRFDLKDKEKPFFLTPSLSNAKDAWRGLDSLVPDIADLRKMYSRRDANLPISAAEAARWVIHCHAFDTAGIKTGALGDPRVKHGKGYSEGIAWCGRMATTAIYGSNFTETLLLNLVMHPLPDQLGIPAWEQEVTTAKARSNVEIGPIGPLSVMTWQSRRIRLKWEGDQVSAVRISYGDCVDFTAQPQNELMTPWKYDDRASVKANRDTYGPMALNPQRVAWRGLDVLLPSTTPSTTKGRGSDIPVGFPAGTVRWVSRLSRLGVIPHDLMLGMRQTGLSYGPKGKNAKIERTLVDALTFRSALIDLDTKLISIARIAALRADEAIKILARFAGNLAIAAGGERKPAVDKARQRAYSVMDPLFRNWLQTLSSPKDENSNNDGDSYKGMAELILQGWNETLVTTINSLQKELLDSTPPDAWRGREHNKKHIDVGVADFWYRVARNKALPRAKNNDSEEQETK